MTYSDQNLLAILQRQRPHGSLMEQEFCEAFIEPIEGIQKDDFGNYWLRIGETETLWSSHTDTVAKAGGYQNVCWDGNILKLHNGKPGQCLGADDGAGMWMMREMIKAGKPGLYIFHRAEEVGGQGSDYIAKKTPELLTGIKRAIAFDRKGTTSVITHQRWSRTASNAFAEELSRRLNQTKGLKYSPDDTGVFTDTANYDAIIAECTNLSVGYENEHGPRETLDVAHLFKLREAILATDFETLPTERDPSEDDFSYGFGFGYRVLPRAESLEDVVRERPFAIAKWLSSRGFTADDLHDLLDEFLNTKKKDYLFCMDCCEAVQYANPTDGDVCIHCGSVDTMVEAFDGRDK